MWHDRRKGISVIQELPIPHDEDLGEFLAKTLKPLQNPVMVIINFTRNPGIDFSHAIKDTKRHSAKIEGFLRHALKKYPQTERIVISGGHDVILYSRVPFEAEV